MLTKENTREGDESYFIRCSCYSHLLNVLVFKEDLGQDGDGFVYLTLYGYDFRYSWINRLKAIWKLFRYGVGGSGELVLRSDEALELGRKIVELSEKIKGK